MSVIRTDQWLLESYERPIEICEKIKVHFHGALASEIYDYLTLHGMYRPFRNGKKLIKKIQENRAWEIVQDELQKLQKMWKGPNVPVYIFPSDPNNRIIRREFNGKSGLAFKDKLFLFISENNNETELRSLLTHEYNHVCRLSKYQKHENDYVLLDTIVLEGLAENAVREKFGKKFVAPWATYYSNKELEQMWKHLVYPNRNMLKTNRKHQDLLYGLRFYPKMLGYCVGYYLVKKYIETSNLESKDLLTIKSAHIAQIKK